MTLARLKRLLPYLGLAAFALAALLVWRSVRAYGVAGMVAAVRDIPPRALLLALAGSAASYATLTLCDWLGVRYAGRRLDWPRAALASFVSLAIGHSLGLAPLGSGALRARYYERWGLGAEAIGKIILFCAVTVTLGQAGLAGIVLLVDPDPAAAWLHASHAIIRDGGGVCLVACAAYLAAAAWLTPELRLGRWRLRLPPLRIAAPQVAVGIANFACLTFVLHVLLASVQEAPFWKVAAIYVLASVAALISHVPGGLGVIEFVVLSFLPTAGTWGALIVFRAVYYILPLVLGGVVLAADEIRTRAAVRAQGR